MAHVSQKLTMCPPEILFVSAQLQLQEKMYTAVCHIHDGLIQLTKKRYLN
jgi:hypothetical protein